MPVMKIHLIALVYLFFLVPAAVCQNPVIDSLKNCLIHQVDQKLLLQTYWDLCYEYADVDNEIALSYGKKASASATQLFDSAMIVKSARLTGYVYRKLGFVDSSNMVSLKVLSYARAHATCEEQYKLMRGIALNYLWMGNYTLALDYNLEAYQLSLEIGNVEYSIPILNKVILESK